MKRILQLCGVAALLSVAVFFGALTFVVLKAWSLRGEVGNAVAARVDLVLQRVTSAADAVVITVNGDPRSKTKDGKLTLRAAALSRVDNAVVTANTQLITMQSEVKAAVDKADAQLTAMRGTVTSLGSKLDPVVGSYTELGEASTALVKDAKDSWDTEWWDVVGLVDSATVATTGVAKTVEAVGNAAPVVTEQVKKIGDSAVKVGNAAATEAYELTKPQTTRQKIAAWLELIPRIAVKVL